MAANNKVKFRLRRYNQQENTVVQNLANLKENEAKKKRAQAHFYKKTQGLSPLIVMKKEPVHARLGGNRNKVVFNGTNTSAIMPRFRNRNYVNQKPLKRMYSAQQRLNTIREKHRTQQNTQRRFRLRRNNIQTNANYNPPPATNFTVQVTNNRVNAQPRPHQFRFKQILTPKIQAEIKLIENEIVHQVIPPMRITPVGTTISMHERFATL